MWEDDEEDEIQIDRTSRKPEEKRHHQSRSSSFSRQPPVFQADSFTKRLGPRSKSTLPRNNDVVQVDKNCCRWPCAGDGPSGGQPPNIRSFHAKEPHTLCALLTRKLFRQKDHQSVPYRAWEDEWAKFREQHDLEMKQMKEMCTSLNEICHELKRMGSRREDASGVSSRHPSASDAPVIGQSKRRGYASYLRENGHHHQAGTRAKSAPKTRVNREPGFIKEYAQDPYGSSRYPPNEALFEESVQMQRFYLRRFVTALVRYDEDRNGAEDGRSLREMVDQLLPHAFFAKDSDFRYGIEAWVSRIAFKEFGKSEEKGPGGRARRKASWEEYQKLLFINPVEAIMPEGEDFVQSFHLFCSDKYSLIAKDLKWKGEWPNKLVTEFMEAMKHVWRAHKLALAFEPAADQFTLKVSRPFDVKFMEPLELPSLLPNYSLSPFTPKVAFIVNPGFIVLDRIIKCQVYLVPDVREVSS